MIDLHLHLDGSLNPDNILHMADMSKISLPCEDKDELYRQLKVSPYCSNLSEYLEKFVLPLQVLQTGECIEYAVYELLRDVYSQGLCYVEIRFAPQLHTKAHLTQDEAVSAAVKGLKRGTTDFDIKAQLILCCMRNNSNHKENEETVRMALKYLGNGVCAIDLAGNEAAYPTGDFADIKGQEILKRGMEIAAAGMHNILMTGPAGSGKSMIAKCLPTILPGLSFEESIEITKIYSVAGLLKKNQSIITGRPFRSPHHTVSAIALAGGGTIPKPGEISLSHNGVLFLDELPEFNRNALEVMRQPLEDREVTIARIHGKYVYPAGFMLVAARNPCPCGMYPDLNKCTCSYRQIRQYNAKISRPLLDRIDINVNVQKVAYEDLLGTKKAETSAQIRKRVLAAQKIQRERYRSESFHFNSQLDGRRTQKYIKLGSAEEAMIRDVFEETDLSARGYNRVLKIARTIADLDGSPEIREIHLKEALFFRYQNLLEDGETGRNRSYGKGAFGYGS